MYQFEFQNSNVYRVTINAPNEAAARQKAMEHWYGPPKPFGLAAQSALFPITPRGKAVYPKTWLGKGLFLISQKEC